MDSIRASYQQNNKLTTTLLGPGNVRPVRLTLPVEFVLHSNSFACAAQFQGLETLIGLGEQFLNIRW
jgi:hypothetical protein